MRAGGFVPVLFYFIVIYSVVLLARKLSPSLPLAACPLPCTGSRQAGDERVPIFMYRVVFCLFFRLP